MVLEFLFIGKILTKREIQNSKLSDFEGFQSLEVMKKTLSNFYTWFSIHSQKYKRMIKFFYFIFYL
jgi:hypothetical protein